MEVKFGLLTDCFLLSNAYFPREIGSIFFSEIKTKTERLTESQNREREEKRGKRMQKSLPKIELSPSLKYRNFQIFSSNMKERLLFTLQTVFPGI